MIDLTLLQDKTFDIKVNEDLILNIRKPNNQMFKDIAKIVEIIEANKEDDKIINIIYQFLTGVFNRNKNDKRFSQKEIEDLFDIDVAMYLIREYQGWVNEVLQDVNF
jgi:hypothetical protein